jgi:hypothetical protein
MNRAVYPPLVFSTGGWLSPAVIYSAQANGLSVMTDWTIRLNAVTVAIGLASVRTAVLVCEFCTKSAIVVVATGSI